MKISKKELISIIQDTETYTTPKVELEQYCIDANSAVDIIYFAGFEFNDITDCMIFDLGAGTGRLSIASAFFKPNFILSIDVDWYSLQVLKKNVENLDLNGVIFPICADINFFEIKSSFLPKDVKITTIMNPPFGVQRKAADRIFLEKAFSFSDVVYSIHLAGKKVQKFISNYIKKFHWTINYMLPFKMQLERSFEFHTQKTKRIDVNIYRFIKN